MAKDPVLQPSAFRGTPPRTRSRRRTASSRVSTTLTQPGGRRGRRAFQGGPVRLRPPFRPRQAQAVRHVGRCRGPGAAPAPSGTCVRERRHRRSLVDLFGGLGGGLRPRRPAGRAEAPTWGRPRGRASAISFEDALGGCRRCASRSRSRPRVTLRRLGRRARDSPRTCPQCGAGRDRRQPRAVRALPAVPALPWQRPDRGEAVHEVPRVRPERGPTLPGEDARRRAGRGPDPSRGQG